MKTTTFLMAGVLLAALTANTAAGQPKTKPAQPAAAGG